MVSKPGPFHELHSLGSFWLWHLVLLQVVVKLVIASDSSIDCFLDFLLSHTVVDWHVDDVLHQPL